jgi:hypothetical protein
MLRLAGGRLRLRVSPNHWDVNDPEFRFKVADKVNAQRHGTPRVAAASKPQ